MSSVLKVDQKPGKLQVNVKALALCTYTLHITHNKNVFKVEYRDSLINHIEDAAISIHELTWVANNIKADNEENFKRRQELQREAVEHCNRLLSLMQIAKPLFHLSAKRIAYWGGLTTEVRGLIKAWSTSDRKRFNENL